jgi:hypothetical protein
MSWLTVKYFIHKLCHWEYWPQALIYAPIFPVYLYYSVKARTPYFTTAANPDIENGGYLMESKKKIYEKLPANYIPKTILIYPQAETKDTIAKMQQEGIGFPLICKPDVGGKGIGVVIANDHLALEQYHKNMPAAYLIQEKINYAHEIGVFYCRYPDSEKGFISGIVEKKDMQITGNGKSTFRELILQCPRFYYQKEFLFQKFPSKLGRVLPHGETFLLSSIGNHARGSEFADSSHKKTTELETLIDKISKQYQTFYFGRYDILFNSWEDLYNGKNFSIIELNGSGSEPTHIYDPKKSIFKAWRIILDHWKIVYRIALQQRKRNIVPLCFKKGNQLQKAYRLHENSLKKLY